MLQGVSAFQALLITFASIPKSRVSGEAKGMIREG
jgi:hypothetical protein